MSFGRTKLFQKLIHDGVVKSPISYVVGFYQALNIPHVLLRA